jgi:predicted house-cleaning NTP pyrophosphatase (Maf/HAM1 superfamily)
MKYSEILKKAKNYLLKGTDISHRADKSHYLCTAIYMAARRGASINRYNTLIAHIDRLMNPSGRVKKYCHVGEWLIKEAGIPLEQLTYENLQDYRHRWLDHLIKEYEEYEEQHPRMFSL